jgi:dolichol-phosphate mannosyltransferase
MNISIVIFCYNEVASLAGVVGDVLAVLESCFDSWEIIIVDDGSKDGTDEVCRQVAARHKDVSVITHPSNLGIGRALHSGYSVAKMEYICAIPGDGQFDAQELKRVQSFEMNMYYSFYRPKTNYSFYRKVLSWVNRLYNQHALGIYLRDVNWVKVYRKEHIEVANLQLQSSLVESELCAKLYWMNVMPIEVPSAYLPRNYGIAKGGSWKTVFAAAMETIRLWWIVQRFKPLQRF